MHVHTQLHQGPIVQRKDAGCVRSLLSCSDTLRSHFVLSIGRDVVLAMVRPRGRKKKNDSIFPVLHGEDAVLATAQAFGAERKK